MHMYIHASNVCICVYSTHVCLAKTFRKTKLVIEYEEIVCTETDHVHTDTTPGSACSHVIQGIIFFPFFYLNPDHIQHWETIPAFLLTAVNQSKKRAIGKHQHIEGYSMPPAFMFLVLLLSPGG